MGNAPENLKCKLPHLNIISTNNDDGVAKYLSNKLELTN
jgi:hydroxymethylpyrimidine pyrophosphatase-like HAD family hydrolase